MNTSWSGGKPREGFHRNCCRYVTIVTEGSPGTLITPPRGVCRCRRFGAALCFARCVRGSNGRHPLFFEQVKAGLPLPQDRLEIAAGCLEVSESGSSPPRWRTSGNVPVLSGRGGTCGAKQHRVVTTSILVEDPHGGSGELYRATAVAYKSGLSDGRGHGAKSGEKDGSVSESLRRCDDSLPTRGRSGGDRAMGAKTGPFNTMDDGPLRGRMAESSGTKKPFPCSTPAGTSRLHQRGDGDLTCSPGDPYGVVHGEV